MSKLRVKNILLLIIFFSGLSHSVLGDTSLKANSYFSKLVLQLKTVAYQETITLNRNTITSIEDAALKNCNETIIFIARDGGQIEEFNITTGASSIATTSPYTTGNLNSLAANPDASIVYYARDKKIYYWEPATNNHGQLADLSGTIGSNESFSSGGGAYYNGHVYMGAEDNSTSYSPTVYRVPVSANGMSTTGSAIKLSVPISSWSSWGDMIVTQEKGNTVIYGGLGAGSANGYKSIYFKYYVELDIYTMVARDLPNELQMAVDVNGDMWVAAANGTELQKVNRKTGARYGNIVTMSGIIWDMTGPFNCPQTVEICGNGIDDDNDGLIDNADDECTTLPRKSTDCYKSISGTGANTVTSTLNISESGIIDDINVVSLDVEHSYIGDLTIKLTSPAGTVVTLINKPCSGADDIFATIDDEATITVAATCPPTDGRNYQPHSSLSAFDGEEINGDWILTVEDDADGDGGQLNCWALEFDTEHIPNVVTTENCNNNIDDDGDGLIDNYDSDCSCITAGIPNINFDKNTSGQAISAGANPSEIWAAWGVHITSDNPSNRPPMIFDSSNPTGNDDDLGTPNADFGGPGNGDGGKTGRIGENNTALGNLLIISTDGNSSNPNDHGSGGTVTFDFDVAVDIASMEIIDFDYGKTDGMIKAYDASNNLIKEQIIYAVGDNGYQKVVLSATGIRKVEVVVPNSFSIASLNFCDDDLPAATIGDLVWNDVNSDGASTGESGISNVKVSLFDNGTNLLAETYTDMSGLYAFDNLPAGEYRVAIDAPSGYTATDDLDADDDNDSGVFTLGNNANKLDVDFGLTNGSTPPSNPSPCSGNGDMAMGAIRNGIANHATGEPDGSTTEVGSSGDYLVIVLADELPVGSEYTIHISGRGGSATSDVFEAPSGTNTPNSQQNSPAGFTQNGQATGAQDVITAVTKTTVVATKYLYFDRGSGDIEIDAVTYDLPCIEICGNGTDDDGDGLVDCADPDCSNNLTVTAALVNTTICNGTSTTLSANATGGDGNYTISWDNGLANGASHTINPTINMTYNVVVTDGNGCTTTDQITITVNDCSIPCGPTTVFSADFENTSGDNNWTLGTGATDGDWEIAVPNPYTQSSVTVMELSPHGSAQTLLTGNGGSQDLDGGPSTAQSPDFTLSTNATSISLDLYYYLSHYTNGDNSDYLRIYLRDASDNSNLVTIINETGANTDRDAVWTQVTTDLLAHAGKTVYLYVTAADLGGGSKLEAAIDDITITEVIPCNPEICDNGIDDDNDGLIDCADPDCSNNLTVTAALTNATICNGESTILSANATGGDGNYTISWDNGLVNGASHTINPTTNATYNVVVTDGNGCTTTDQITITVTTCGTPEICDNNIDDDGDGDIDENDADCNCTNGLINLALGKTATQSSNYNGTATANLAIDGDTNGVFGGNSVTHSGTELNAWWEIDLGSAVDIKNIRIWNRTDCCQNRLANFYVFVSDNPFASNTPATTAGDVNVWNEYVTDAPTSNTVVSPFRTGRYVRIQLTEGNPLSLAEVEIIGCDAGTPVPEICDNGIDDDGDNLIDCADPDCSNNLTITAATTKNSMCDGEIAILSASATGGDGSYTYTWSNGLGDGTSKSVNPTTTTTYTVTVTDGNTCTSTDQITIAIITAGCSEICDNNIDDDNDGLIDSYDPDCSCITAAIPNINFDKNTNGQAIAAGANPSEIWAAWGVHITSDNPSSRPPMIFDSSNPTGNDDDLGTPNGDFGGPGVGDGGKTGRIGENNTALGNLLIISTNGDSNDPNDHASGGTVTFNFDVAVDVASIEIVDFDYGKTDGVIKAYDASNTLIKEQIIYAIGDNGYQKTVVSATGIRKVEVIVPNSFSIAALNFCDDDLPTATIGDLVWNDENNDGLATGESGIANVKVSLYDDASHLLAETYTDMSGIYAFNNLPAGQYRVAIDAPSGYTATGDLDADDDNDSGVFTLGNNANKLDVDFGLNNGSTPPLNPSPCSGNGDMAMGATRNGIANHATGEPDGSTTEIGSSGDYLVVVLADELPVGSEYTIHISGRGGSATSDVFEAPNGTTIPTSQQNSPSGFTQNGQATGAQDVITAVTKTTIVATKYLYFDRGSGDIEIDAVTYNLNCTPEICDNGIDDDGDNLIDCADPDCTNYGSCQPDTCSARITNNLVALYNFKEANGTVVYDVSGVGTPINLTIQDGANTNWEGDCGLAINSETIIQSAGAATKVIDAIKASNAITIEAWIKSANTTQSGPARLLTLSSDGYNRNFTLGQQGTEYATRFRTNDSNVDINGTPTIQAGNVTTDLIQHVVYTWENTTGVEKIYVDGVEAYSGNRAGDISNWDDTYQLAIGNEIGVSRDWLGAIYLVAIYDKALNNSEIENNYDQGYCCTGLPEVIPEISCEDGRAVDFIYTGLQNAVPAMLTIPDEANIDSIVVEVIYKSGDPGNTLSVQDASGNSYTGTKVDVAAGARIYRMTLPATSSISYTDETVEDKAQSMAAYVFRNGQEGKAYVSQIVNLGGYNTTEYINFPLPTRTEAHDIVVKLPVSEVTYDDRELDFSASAGGITTSINRAWGPNSNGLPNGCCMDVVELVLTDVPVTAKNLTVAITSPATNGQSFVVTGLVFAELRCFDTEICDNGIDDDNDGLIDCADPDCSNYGICYVDTCSARVTNNLVALYNFKEATGTVVHDVSGVGTPIDLTIQNGANTNWKGDCGLSINNETIIQSTVTATKIIDAIKASNAITIEAWIKSANVTQAGPARIVTLSGDGSNRNFTLGQEGTAYAARFRTNDNSVDINGTPTIEAGNVTTDLIQHVVYTWESTTGVEKIYVDGVEAYSGNRAGDVSNWVDTYRLAIGNEMGTSRDWLGDIYLVAIYDKALDNSEIENNYDQGHCCVGTPEEICDNGIDDDGDGLIDCYDPDCANSGTAITVVAETGIVNPANAIGLADGNAAALYEPTDLLTVDLGVEIPQGETYMVTWKRKSTYTDNATADLKVEESIDNSNWTLHPITLSTASKTTYTTTDVIANTNTRYLRFSILTGSGDDVDLDAITYSCIPPVEICDDGIDNDGDGLIDCADPDCNNNLTITGATTKASICNGDNAVISVTATGGDGNYTFSWNNSLANGSSHTVNPTTSTTYNVTVMDGNGCMETNQITVTVTTCSEICDNGIDDDNDGLVDCADPDCQNITTTVSTGCNSIDLSIAGGNAPYTYTWSDMVTPTAHWTFENTSNDISGNANHQNTGASSGTIAYAADAVEGQSALSLDGSTYIRYSMDGAFMETAFTEWGISCWIKPNGLTGLQTIIDEGGSTNGIAVRLNNATLEFAARDGGIQVNAGTHTIPNDGAWHHISAVYANDSLQLFLDGIPGTATYAGFPSSEVSAHSGNGGIGYYDSGSGFGNSTADYYTGLIDDFKYFYNQSLTPSQIADLARNDGDRTNLTSGTYTVMVVDADGGCPASETVTIFGNCTEICDNGIDDDGDNLIDCADPDCNNGLTITAALTKSSICEGENVNLSASATGGDGNYTFTWDNLLPNGANHTVNPIYTTAFNVTVTDGNGCTATNQIVITVNTCTEICDNGIDDDFDGMIDCDDSDCSPDGANVFDGCITVNSTGDEGDTNPGDGKCMTVNCDCTLRAAIEEANALAGKDTICYDIPVPEMDYDGTKWTITPMSLFENLTEAVFIDGYTQIGSAMGTTNAAAILKIKINGENLPADGAIFQTTADGSKLTGMVISGNDATGNSCGVNLQSDNNEIVGNYIGVEVDGTTAFANGTGVLINGDSNRVGGILVEDANIIANNAGSGIEVVNPTSQGNLMLRNSYTGNGGLAIDLSNQATGDSVTENDTTDADTGANELLNFPELVGAAIVGTNLYYDFYLDVPAGFYRIEFYSSAAGDPSGHGEGTTFIGHLNISHSGNGRLQFFGSLVPEVTTSIGSLITLTATECADGSCVTFNKTSEFNGTTISERCDDLTDPGTIAGDEEGCTNPFDPSMITSVSAGGGGEGGPIYYQWQELPAGNSVWKDIIGATNVDHDPITIAVTTSYRRQAIRAKCSSTWQTSNIVTKTINGTVSAEIITAPSGTNGFICGAAAYEFEAADAGAGFTYAWDFGENANPRYQTGKGPHYIGFLAPTDSVAINNEVLLEVAATGCAAYDTIDFSINPIVYSSNVITTNPTTCGASDGSIQVTASGGKNLCIKVSLDGGITYQPDGQLLFTGLSENTYNVVLNYCNIDCPNQYGYVTLREPTEIIAVNDEIQNACPGFGFSGNVSYNDQNNDNTIYTILTNPTKGTVVMSTAGAFEFSPTAYECGIDRFIYQVCNLTTGCCATGIVTLNFEDEIVPELENVPADLTINCDEEIPLAPLVSAFDNCPAISIDKMESNTQGEDGCSLYDYTITRTWTASDLCGNTASDEQIVRIRDITAPDIFRIYTLPNGKKMVAGVMENVTQRWKTIQFPIDFPTVPVVFTQVISTIDSSAVAVRMRNTSIAQFELKLQEEEANDNIHGGEKVAWIAIEEGTNVDGFKLEVGTILADHNFTNINFNNTHDGGAAVFTTLQSILESDPATVRCGNGTANSVSLRVEEETSADSETDHIAERVGYLAVDTLTYLTNDKNEVIGEVGTVEINAGIIVVSSNNYYYNPVIIAKYVDENQTEPVLVNVRILSNNSFELALDGWEYQTDIATTGKISLMIIEGSLPLDIEDACVYGTDSLVLGVDIVAIDNCDNNVSIVYEETTTYDGPAKIIERNYYAVDECGNATSLTQTIHCSGVALRTKAMLQGAMIRSTDASLMRDDLRKNVLVPEEEPYTELSGFTHYGTGGREKLDPALLTINGPNAIVDWVMIELRDRYNPSKVLTTQSGLLQRDGDVVTVTGDSIMVFENVPVDDYYVSIKHRNHLAMYSLYAQRFGPAIVPFVDFTNSFTPVMGDVPGVELDGKRAMWSGDISGDAKIIFQGPQNDIFQMFFHILTQESNAEFLTNFISRGYTQKDFNLDGKVIYQGPGNDRSPLLYHTVLEHPENGSNISNFVVQTGIQRDSIIIEPSWTAVDECASDYTKDGCDFDGDGLINEVDFDKDADGVADSLDIAMFDKNSDSDGDGITDNLENGGDGKYDLGIDSNPLDPCDPNPLNGSCLGIDEDGDGFFANYPTIHILYDALDNEACYPDVANGNCDCRDTDNDGMITVCHIPGDNYSNRETKKISVNAWLAHKGHDDVCGPCNYDEDLDGVPESHDVDSNDPYSDSDGDGIADIVETGGDGLYNVGIDTNPLSTDTDDDGVEDGMEDTNKNGVFDAGESNPLSFCDPINSSAACDFDEDGQSNQIDTDDDNDGVMDVDDSNPYDENSDSDGDYFTDIEEKAISDPLNPCDPEPSATACAPVDADGDGYFANYATTHTQYDSNDADACVPAGVYADTFSINVIADKDSWIEREPNSGGWNNNDDNHGSDIELHIKKESSEPRRTLLHFDLAPQAGNVITEAKLKLYIKTGEDEDVVVQAYELTKFWDEGAGGGEYFNSNHDDVLWVKATNNKNWTNEGGDYNSTLLGEMETSSIGWVETTIPTAVVQDWIDNPTTNFGIILLATGADEQLVRFYSSEATSGKRPQLVLEMQTDVCNGESLTNNGHGSNVDSDGDGIYDHIEIGGDGNYDEGTDTNPNEVDTDGDGLSDSEEDSNKNGSVDSGESDPREKCDPSAINPQCDFDGDGWKNAWDSDDDNDGVPDNKDTRDFDPNSDSDDDGITDIEEKGVSDPLDPCDPISDMGPCVGTDNDFDGFYTNVPLNDPQYDANDEDACVPSTANGTCECPDNVNDAGEMTICFYVRNNQLTYKTHPRDWLYFKATWNATCGPCGAASSGDNSNLDSDGDGITDKVETGGDFIYDEGTDSDHLDACDPYPTHGDCMDIDEDNDGYFANYATGHAQYDADDANACIPNPSANNCVGVDADEDGYFANYPSTHTQFDPHDTDVNNPSTSTVGDTVTIGQDNYIKEKSKNRADNYGAKPDLHVVNKTNELEQGLMQFDLSAYAGQTVTGATLHLHAEKSDGIGTVIEAYKTLSGWTEGTGTGGSGSTGISNWDEATSTTSWTTPGGDYGATLEGTMAVPAVGYHRMSLSASLIQDWIDNPSTNFGLLFKSTGPESDKHTEFNTFDGPAATRPYLVLNLDESSNIDVDGDGYFANFAIGHPQYDTDDANACVPDVNNGFTSTVIVNQGIDTYIKEKFVNRGENHGKIGVIQHKARANDHINGLLQFDLTPQSGINVVSATLYMYLEGGNGGGNTIEAHRITTPWEEGTKDGWAGTCNWDEATNTTAWTNPGGDYNASVEGVMTTESVGYKTMTLSAALVQDWIDNPTTNAGLLLKSIGGDANKLIQFTSFDGATGQQPYLELIVSDCGGAGDNGGNCEDIDGDGNITICHNGITTQDISTSEWATHEAHGDICGPCADYKTIAAGNWNSAATWEGGIIPPTTIDGQSVIINHTLTVQSDITVKGRGHLWVEGSSFALQNGKLIIEDGTVILKDVAFSIQYSLELKNSNSIFQMKNGALSTGQLFKNEYGTIYLENVCLTAESNYQSINGNETWKNVCAIMNNGSYQLSGSTVNMENVKLKILNGNFQNQNNSTLTGIISALHIPNGNLENTANWGVTVMDYCVSSNVSVLPAYLPASENCTTIDTNFSPCNCSGN